MKIHNVRLGFATNSSSSHSIIFDPSINPGDDYDDFGWSFFTASSASAKEQYIAATLSQNLCHDYPPALVSVIMKGLGLPEQERDSWGYSELTVDHQSLFNLPREFDGKHVSMEFFEEFRQYLLRDGVHILGGNDNTEGGHYLADGSKEVSFGGWGPERETVNCRKDGDWWTLYSRHSGNRVVLSFEDNPAPYQPETPMLMDVKITDYCTHGCAYCYQGSTPSGQHMDKDKVYSYSGMIAGGKVFEIAIGGGEPTQCPHFEDFVRWTSEQGVVVNFTTKSTDWLEDEQRAAKILPRIGAFAYSADDKAVPNLDRIHAIFKYRGYDLRKFTVQIVPATMGEYALKSLLMWCNEHDVRATMLGYKETGRGAKFKEIGIAKRWDKFDETKWLKVVEQLNQEKKLGKLSIDTTMAARYLDQLKQTGIPAWMYHTEEGKYSLYVDMVANTFGPSSYHVDLLKPFDLHKADLREMFASVEPV